MARNEAEVPLHSRISIRETNLLTDTMSVICGPKAAGTSVNRCKCLSPFPLRTLPVAISSPDTSETRSVIAAHPWSTAVVVMSNGVAIGTSNYETGRIWSTNCLVWSGNRVKPCNCNLQILTRVNFSSEFGNWNEIGIRYKPFPGTTIFLNTSGGDIFRFKETIQFKKNFKILHLSLGLFANL